MNDRHAFERALAAQLAAEQGKETVPGIPARCVCGKAAHRGIPLAGRIGSGGAGFAWPICDDCRAQIESAR